MLKPSVCIDAVFEGRSLEEAVSAVAAAGISAFEFWGWWDKDLDAVQAAQQKHGLEISACCTKFISLVDPAKRQEYLRGLSDSIAAAQRLGVKTLISQVGDFIKGRSREEQEQSLVDGLKEAAPLLEQSGVTLVIEPLNELVDHPGYFLIRSADAFRVIERVASPSVKVVYDIYHQQVSEGHLIDTITRNFAHIAHFHAAGNPGRHELTRGEIQYRKVFDAIQATAYSGYVGLEYWPVDDPAGGLREVASWFSTI